METEYTSLPAECDPSEEAASTTIQRRLDAADGFGPVRITTDTSYVTGVDKFACVTGTTSVTMTTSGNSYVCQKNDILTDAKKSFVLEKLLPAAVDWFAATLQVKSLANPIKYTGFSSCATKKYYYACCDNQIDKLAVSSTGVPNSDMHIIVTTRPADGGTIAWAISCTGDEFDRPIVGQINFDPERLDSSVGAWEEQLATAIHELTHAFGFSNSLYGKFRQPLNGAVRPRSQVVLTVGPSDASNKLGKTINKIITPKVVANAKAHFGCTDWANAGLEIEDGGSAGTAGSHWEKRLMNNEFMTGTSNKFSRVSSMTLGLFEDMGWYKVNYDSENQFAWGAKQGCPFVQEKCSSWTSMPKFSCNTVYSSNSDGTKGVGCTHDYRSKAYCNLIKSASTFPSYFQYFSDPTVGGSDSYMDSCPVYKDFADGDCRNLDGKTSAAWYFGEQTGKNSKCFTGTYSQVTSLGNNIHAGCHPFSCSDGLKVTVGTTVIDCPAQGGVINMETDYPSSGYSGTFNCPPIGDICTAGFSCKNDCSNDGTCLSSGICQCNDGKTGVDCSEFSCPKFNGEECGGVNQGECNRVTGKCTCKSQKSADGKTTINWSGFNCGFKDCPKGYQDQPCGFISTGNLQNRGTCDANKGQCICSTGYYGDGCEKTRCPGYDAVKALECNGGGAFERGKCDPLTGACSCNYIPPAQGSSLAEVDSYYDYYQGSTCSTSVTTKLSRYIPIGGKNETSAVKLTGTANEKEYVYYSAVIESVGAGLACQIKPLTADDDVDVYARIGALGVKNPAPPSSSYYDWSSTSAGNAVETIPILPDDPKFSSSGVLLVAILSNRVGAPSQFEISVNKDPCTNADFAKCSGHGKCEAARCKCDNLWSGETCGSADCLGSPDCSDHGKCVVIDNKPTCQCGRGWNDPKCSTADSSIKVYKESGKDLADVTLDNKYSFSYSPKIVKDPVTNTVKDERLEIGEFAYFQVDLKDIANIQSKAALTVQVKADEKSAKADLMLAVRAGDLLDFNAGGNVMDFNSWYSRDRSASIFLDVPNTLRSAIWYIGVYNTMYSQAQLNYTLTASLTTSGCPKVLNNCNGRGTCDISNNLLTPTCTCNQSPGHLYSGVACEIDVTFLESGKTYIPKPITVGNWTYAAITYDGKTSANFLIVKMERLRPKGEAPITLVRYGRLPTLDDDAAIDFPSIERSSVNQTISIPNISPGTYYIGLYNHNYGFSAVEVKLTASISSQSTILDSCLSGKDVCTDPKLSPSCGCNGVCSSFTCICTKGWGGATCSTPPMKSLTKLIGAAQKIESLCNVCTEVRDMSNDDFRIFRIPQPLGSGTGLTISVKALASPAPGGKGTAVTTSAPANNSVSLGTGDPDIYISKQLPRSFYDFKIINATAGPTQTYKVTEKSSTGRFYLAVYVSTAGKYQISVSRDEYVVPVDDKFLLQQMWIWLTATKAGNLMLAVTGSLIGIGALFLCFRCLCEKKPEAKSLAKAMESDLGAKLFPGATQHQPIAVEMVSTAHTPRAAVSNPMHGAPPAFSDLPSASLMQNAVGNRLSVAPKEIRPLSGETRLHSPTPVAGARF